MPYRERVIESLESHVNESCAKCKYRESDAQFCLKELLKDAVELLKEQEPKSAIIEGSDVAHVGRCPSCHVILTPFRANYCYCCGQGVKWDVPTQD